MLPADLFSIPLSKDLALLIAIKHNQSVASRKTPEPKIIIRIKSHTGPRFIKKITIRIRIHNPKILFSKICIFFRILTYKGSTPISVQFGRTK